MTRDTWSGTGTIVIDLDDNGFRIITMAHPPKGMAQFLADTAGQIVMEELRDLFVLVNLGGGLVAMGEAIRHTPLLHQRVTP